MMCKTCGTTFNIHIHGDLQYCPHDSTILTKRVDDQSLDAIQERFDAFHAETKPLLDEYKAEGKLIEINGMQSIEAIAAEIMTHL